MNDKKIINLKNPFLIVVIIITYLLSTIIFYFGYWQQYKEQQRLEQLIETENRNQVIFNQVIEQRIELESTIKTQQTLNDEYEKLLPRSYDLPVFLDGIRELAKITEVSLQELRYFSLRKDRLSQWYPIFVEISGDYQHLAQFVQNILNEIPSVNINSLAINSGYEGILRLLLELDLYVVPLEWETEKEWEKPIWKFTETQIVTKFGIPLSYIQEYYSSNSLKLLGIVFINEHGRALISYQGVEQWKQIGDYVGVGKISRIGRNKVYINLKGFEITLSMGG